MSNPLPKYGFTCNSALGVLHCENGPAITWNDGVAAWFVRGIRILSYGELQKMTGCSDEDVILLKIKHGDITDQPVLRAE